jgi:hypothetical protein
MSPEYYTRLEQGRHPTASPSVLDSLAGALRLRAEERSYLFAVARAKDTRPPDDGDQNGLRLMLGAFGRTPAVLCAGFSDILAANDAACFLYDTDLNALPAAERNTIHWMLTSPVARGLYGEAWEQCATGMIGKLRMECGQRPDHPRAQALVAQLDHGSELFGRVWARHEVSACVQEINTFRHRLGVFRMRGDAVTMQSSPGHVFYIALPVDDAFEKACENR